MPARFLRRAAVPALTAALLAAGATEAAAAPRVVDARLTPRAVHQGQQARLRVVVATPGTVRVTLDLRRRGRLVRMWLNAVPVEGDRVSVKLPRRLLRGRYVVSTVSIDANGVWSRTVKRSLRVLPRR